MMASKLLSFFPASSNKLRFFTINESVLVQEYGIPSSPASKLHEGTLEGHARAKTSFQKAVCHVAKWDKNETKWPHIWPGREAVVSPDPAAVQMSPHSKQTDVWPPVSASVGLKGPPRWNHTKLWGLKAACPVQNLEYAELADELNLPIYLL